MASRISAENGTAEPAAVATKESSTETALECCNYVQTGGLLDNSENKKPPAVCLIFSPVPWHINPSCTHLVPAKIIADKICILTPEWSFRNLIANSMSSSQRQVLFCMPIKKDLKACIQRNGPANSALHVYALEWMAGEASSLQTKKNSMLPWPYLPSLTITTCATS